MFTALGSLDALSAWWSTQAIDPSDVVIVGTAAAFIGAAAAGEAVRTRLGGGQILALTDRSSALDTANATTLTNAAIIMCVDGSPLHARTVWRQSPVGDVLCTAPAVALGGVASVFGSVMIDPRGGAPTTALGRFDGVALMAPSDADQTTRTQQLLGPSVALVELGPSAIVHFDGTWRVASSDVVITKAGQPAAL